MKGREILDALLDCQEAYKWLLENGPDRASSASQVVVAGDSAGGNLTLAILAWARDEGLRQPDAAVAIAPATDSTFSSPSIKANIETDHMLGPFMGPMTKIPHRFLVLSAWMMNKISPADPRVSPLHGNLDNLPPLLIHASESEMLRDDAVRYTNKAREAGSPVTLETWNDMLHVWHAFVETVPESQDAFEHIEAFLTEALAGNNQFTSTHVISAK